MTASFYDEEHWCWQQCCDQGPHGCICGNDCEQKEVVKMTMLQRIREFNKVAQENRENQTRISILRDQQREQSEENTQLLQQLTTQYNELIRFIIKVQTQLNPPQLPETQETLIENYVPQGFGPQTWRERHRNRVRQTPPSDGAEWEKLIDPPAQPTPSHLGHNSSSGGISLACLVWDLGVLREDLAYYGGRLLEEREGLKRSVEETKKSLFVTREELLEARRVAYTVDRMGRRSTNAYQVHRQKMSKLEKKHEKVLKRDQQFLQRFIAVTGMNNMSPEILRRDVERAYTIIRKRDKALKTEETARSDTQWLRGFQRGLGLDSRE